MSTVSIYYHMTPEARLPAVLTEGLRKKSKKSLSVERDSDTSNRIYLGNSIEEVREQLDISEGSPEFGRNFAVLEVSLPANYPVKTDEWGFKYTTRDIPSKYLRVVWKDSVLFAKLRALRGTS